MKVIRSSKKERLFQYLKQAIIRGNYPTGTSLPKEVELAAQLGVARDTLRPALERLAQEGIILRIKGKGTFVNPEPGGCGKILIIINDEPGIATPSQYIMPGIQSAAMEQNIPLEICSYRLLETLSLEDGLRMIRQNQPRGILLLANNFHGNERTLDFLRPADLPLLLPHTTSKDLYTTGFSVMAIDYRQVYRQAMEHLHHCGHQRMGTIFMPENNGYLRQIPPQEYAQMLRDYQLADEPELIVRSPYNHQAIEAGVRQLLSLPRPPTALFCFSDFFALIVYEILKQLQLRIPEDIALVAIGGHTGCNYLSPGLTAVDLQYFSNGYQAVHRLKEMILAKNCGNPLPSREFAIETQLIVRGSTVKAASKSPKTVNQDLATPAVFR